MLSEKQRLHLEKVAKLLKGRKFSEEHKNNISLAKRGEKHPLWGKHLSKETRERISIANKGKKRSDEAKVKYSLWQKGKHKSWQRGDKSHFWKGGISTLRKRLWASLEYKKWRTVIYQRDNWTCQTCNNPSTGNLEAHHKKSFFGLIQEAVKMSPLLDRFDACILYQPLWDIGNGITLCKECHKMTKNYPKNLKGGH